MFAAVSIFWLISFVFLPRSQMFYLFPVVGFISLGDETHQSCVVRKLYQVVEADSACLNSQIRSLYFITTGAESVKY